MTLLRELGWMCGEQARAHVAIEKPKAHHESYRFVNHECGKLAVYFTSYFLLSKPYSFFDEYRIGY